MILLCDHVQDPHNLGAMIRSAEAAGASAVLIPKTRRLPADGDGNQDERRSRAAPARPR